MDDQNYFWQGTKVRLRPFTIADAEQSYLNALDSPARQVLQLGIELPTSVEAERKDLENYANCKDVEGVVIFAIETLAGELVGGISWHSRSPKNGTFSFGIGIYAGHRKNGYAEDATRILLRYSFFERRFQKCNSACTHNNLASIRLHQKLGFLEEGCRRRQVYMNGQFYGEILFGLTKEEFEANEKNSQGMH